MSCQAGFPHLVLQHRCFPGPGIPREHWKRRGVDAAGTSTAEFGVEGGSPLWLWVVPRLRLLCGEAGRGCVRNSRWGWLGSYIPRSDNLWALGDDRTMLWTSESLPIYCSLNTSRKRPEAICKSGLPAVNQTLESYVSRGCRTSARRAAYVRISPSFLRHIWGRPTLPHRRS